MTGPASLQQQVRVFASLDAVPPIDRWNDLTAQSEALEQRMDEVLEAHRADCRARYGRDFEGGE